MGQARGDQGVDDDRAGGGGHLPTTRRPATLAEARAMAHPDRLRIIRLTFDAELTNKQLADQLGRDPATTLHHVRTLVDNGFLEALPPPRHGAGVRREAALPVHGQSWALRSGARAHRRRHLGGDPGPAGRGVRGAPQQRQLTRMALRLSPEQLARLQQRIHQLIDEAASWTRWTTASPGRCSWPYTVVPTCARLASHEPDQPSPRQMATSPNVVTIVFDDLASPSSGPFGSDVDTPASPAWPPSGLRYNRFHVTSLCSPTRAALLAGRNHHAVGMGFLADLPLILPGLPGGHPAPAATLPRILRDAATRPWPWASGT